MCTRVDQFNSVISGIATARNWIYVDMNAFLAPLRAETTAAELHRLLAAKLATDINAKYATTVSTTPPP